MAKDSVRLAESPYTPWIKYWKQETDRIKADNELSALADSHGNWKPRAVNNEAAAADPPDAHIYTHTAPLESSTWRQFVFHYS